ncbi:hypothetical protein OROGR_003078 [Orobanche gracilis]
MDSDCSALAWVANLHKQFNFNFYLDADGTTPQEPIEYVRKHLLTARENIKKLYSELVEDVLPVLSFGCLEESSRTFPRMVEDMGFPSREISSTGIDDCEQERRVSAITSFISLHAESMGKIYEHFTSKEKGKLETSESSKTSILATSPVLREGCDNVGALEDRLLMELAVMFKSTRQPLFSVRCSWSILRELRKLPPFQISPLTLRSINYQIMKLLHFLSKQFIPVGCSSERIQAPETKSSYVTELDGIFSAQPSGWQNLDESFFLVDGEDEFCSDSDMKADHAYYQLQKIETPLLDEKFIEISPCKTVSEGFDEDKEAREWEKLDEDVCDSEWEIISSENIL